MDHFCHVPVQNKNFEALAIYGHADINYSTPNGYTALIIAVSKGNVAIVEVLLQYGSDITATTTAGDDAVIGTIIMDIIVIYENQKIN